jgi:DNA polymerase III sliding clamp (beta) subunit (PCNA family)
VKITVRINEFKRVLEEAHLLIKKNKNPAVAALSWLRYVLVQVNDVGRATMTATDLGVSIIQSFEVVNGDAGSLLLHAEKVHSLLKGQVGGTATIETVADKGGSVVIKAGAFTRRVPSIRVTEFPPCEPMPAATHTISLKFLKRLLALVEVAALDKANKYLSLLAVQVEGTADRLRAAATDSFRIAVSDQTISGGTEFTLLIPKTVVPLIKRRAGATVRLAESETHIFLQTDGVLLQFRKVAGRFPAYQKAIALEATTTLDVNTAEFKSVVERVSRATDPKNPHVYLTYADGALSVCTSSVENGEAEARVEVQNATGISNKVKLAPDFVLEFLARAGDRTTISLVSERHLATFASGGFRYYIMPMVEEREVRAKLEAEVKALEAKNNAEANAIKILGGH